MENVKFKLEYKRSEKIMLIIMLSLFTISAIMNILRVFSLFSFQSYDLFIDIAGIVFSVIMGLFIFSTLKMSKYYFENEQFVEQISIFKTKIKYANIVKLVSYTKNNTLYLFYVNKKNRTVFTKIIISQHKYDQFVNALREINSSITYEITGDNK